MFKKIRELYHRVNDWMAGKSAQQRIVMLSGIMLLMMGVIVFRYGWLQLVEGNELSERMEAQVGHDYAIQTPRGAILDRNGRELAVSTMTKSLFVDPSHISEASTTPEELAAELAPLIHMSEQDVLDDIHVGGGFVWIKRRLPEDEYEAVRDLIKQKNLSVCLNFRDEAKRFYPNDELAANVIGFIGTDDKGLDGIEQSMNSLLRGEVKETHVETDRQSRPIFDSIFSSRRTYNGDYCKSVTLTIDSAIQFLVEQELDRAIAENHPKGITCVVMNPKTGEVLAMASRPSYNPNQFWEYSPELWRNNAVSFIYEPGSTFKSVVLSAALQENVVTPDQVFVDPGYIMVSGRRIQNWSGTSFGTVTFTDVVKQSLNTGFAMVGLRLGGEKLTNYAKLFGFGQKTGIDLPGEESGILFNPDDMRDSDVATMAIGQSIAVTPLQLVTAVSAIANDGVLMKPQIIKEIKNPDGTVYDERQPQQVRRAIDSATAKTAVGLLEQVVASGGGKKAAVKGYRIAGKTGTAQKIREDGSGYMDGHYIASFCGFAPVEDPQITVLVMIDDPSPDNYYGGQIAAPVAGRIFTQLFRYLHIQPSSDPFAGMTMPSTTTMEEPTELTGDRAGQDDDNMPQPQDGQVVVPDMTGKSIREAAQLAASAGLSFESDGSGYASSQSLPPGSAVDRGTSITVYFKPD